MNCKDAEVINKLSNENHIVIKCCQQREYNGLYLFIKNNINQIGKIIHINYNFTLNDQNQSWYWEKDK
jgi:predicted dehydrogenase